LRSHGQELERATIHDRSAAVHATEPEREPGRRMCARAGILCGCGGVGLALGRSALGVVLVPVTRYARTDDGVAVAYQVVGDGPLDIVYANSFMSHVEVLWDYPRAARFCERMAAFSRLILFDRRGTGLSDPIVDRFTMDDRVSDLAAVMDAVGLDQAVLLGSSEGAAACTSFAAVHPERVTSLVLFSPAFVTVADRESPWAWSSEYHDLILATLDDAWATGTGLEVINPSLADDAEARSWYARYFRMSASPGLARALMRHNATMDVRSLLATIEVPTLLLHRTDETWISVEQSRYAARNMRHATLVELPGTDHYIWEQDSHAVTEEIEEFLTGVRRHRPAERALVTLVFTDIVRSTDRVHQLGDERWNELLNRQEAAANRQLTRFDGTWVKNTGDGMFATFASPVRAIRCALAIREASRGLGIEIRAGIHTGEVERRPGDDLGGIAVHIAARVAACAAPSEVLVSRTVADLIAGSEVHLIDRGVHELKGIPDGWRLYSAEI
jgi:pimeloyl-ACP methyl ester carboxylesterase